MELRKYKLGDICDLNLSSLKTSDRIDEIFYLDTSNITENKIADLQRFSIADAPSRAQRKVKNNTIIFSTVRPNQNHFGIIKNPQNNLIVSSGFATLDIKNSKDFDANYIYLKLTQPCVVNYLQTLAQNSVSAYPSINPDDIGNLSFDFPPIEIQQKIAGVLFSLDNKIALNRRMNAKLEQMAKRLYDYWFVQFDFPNADGQPYKSSGGKMEYNETLKREIPAGWEVKRLGDSCDIVLGGTPSTSNEDFWNNGTINWLNSGEVASFPIVSSEKKITEEALNQSTTEFLKAGSVTLSITRYLRPSILAIDACINQSVVGIKENETFKNCFLYPYLQNEIDRLMSLRTGAQQPHINKETVEDSSICVPSVPVMEKYIEKSKPIYDEIVNIAKETNKLTAMRDRLLPLLMNGQVEVE